MNSLSIGFRRCVSVCRWRVVGASILMLNQSEAADKEEEVEELVLYNTSRVSLSLSVSLCKQKGFNDIQRLQEEDVSDEAFARRHLVSERKEKMHRMSWGKRPCCRHPKRFVEKKYGI